MIKVSGFYINYKGDPTVGIFSTYWKLVNDFIFEDDADLLNFKNGIKELFELYVDSVIVETFEEVDKRIDDEKRLTYSTYPLRYLIRDKGYGFNTYKMASSAGSYSKNIGEAIHTVLPKWIDEKGDYDTEVIKSSDPEFNKILFKEVNKLENEINDLEYKLRIAKNNLNLIQDELKYGVE